MKGVSSLVYISEDETDFPDHGTANVTQSYAAMESCFGSIQYLRIGYLSHDHQTFTIFEKSRDEGCCLQVVQTWTQVLARYSIHPSHIGSIAYQNTNTPSKTSPIPSDSWLSPNTSKIAAGKHQRDPYPGVGRSRGVLKLHFIKQCPGHDVSLTEPTSLAAKSLISLTSTPRAKSRS